VLQYYYKLTKWNPTNSYSNEWVYLLLECPNI
jgi:hypothetical protein